MGTMKILARITWARIYLARGSPPWVRFFARDNARHGNYGSQRMTSITFDKKFFIFPFGLLKY